MISANSISENGTITKTVDETVHEHHCSPEPAAELPVNSEVVKCEVAAEPPSTSPDSEPEVTSEQATAHPVCTEDLVVTEEHLETSETDSCFAEQAPPSEVNLKVELENLNSCPINSEQESVPNSSFVEESDTVSQQSAAVSVKSEESGDSSLDSSHQVTENQLNQTTPCHPFPDQSSVIPHFCDPCDSEEVLLKDQEVSTSEKPDHSSEPVPVIVVTDPTNTATEVQEVETEPTPEPEKSIQSIETISGEVSVENSSSSKASSPVITTPLQTIEEVEQPEEATVVQPEKENIEMSPTPSSPSTPEGKEPEKLGTPAPETREPEEVGTIPPPKPRRRSLDSSPVAPPRRLSSAFVRSGTSTPVKKMSTVSYGSGKIFQNGALPRNARPPTREDAGKKKKKSMFSWLGGDSSKKKNKEVLETVSEGLRKIYKQKLYPLEEYYKFHEFHSPALDDPDFDAKPMILLVGQYSTGKTTFIRHLLEKDFPGIRIGPEPTTDRFIAVMHGDEEGVIPGNALVVDAKKQFRALSGFGNAFLNRFQCSTLPNQVLESVTIVDTPGILSGEKQRIDRGYDFTGVLEWFAERVDRIILLFDAHKLDISDEFKRCIEALAGNEDKIRIVLNKSDMVDHQQLMRVYGALMWSLGKVFRTPEVSRVYLGSFWDHPLHYDINRRLFQDEQHDLFQDLQALPRNAALRKLNDLIKRARLAKVHAYIIAELRKQMPSMIGKDKKKKELIQNLDKIFEQLQREHNISPGDFPDVQKMREKLANQDFTKFNPIKPKLLEVVDGMLASDIARLMAQIPKEEQVALNVDGSPADHPSVKGGAFSQAQEADTPFGFGRGEGFDKGANESEWVVSRERGTADTTFESLGPVGGFLSGRVAKEHMVKSKLPNAVLGKIWKLADVDKDGQLDGDEFALANYLINLKLEGHELPAELPDHLVPPSKRDPGTVYPTLDEE